MSYAKPIPAFIIEKFLSRISAKTEGECWPWVGHINKSGYGAFTISAGKIFLAHRISFDLFNEKVIETLVIDHICKNRRCVNPKHLRQVYSGINVTENSDSPSAENKLKTHCPKGHEYNEENIYIATTKRKTKGRACRTCALDFKKRTYDSAARRLRTIRDKEKRKQWLTKTENIRVG